MGQVETKVFEHQAPPWDAEEVCKKTDLTKDDIKYAPNLKLRNSDKKAQYLLTPLLHSEGNSTVLKD